MSSSPSNPPRSHEHKRRRRRRHRRRAYIRSIYFLPSLATLGNAVCGFGAMYVAALAEKQGRPEAQIYRDLAAAAK